MNKDKINEFLLFWKQIILENPELDFHDRNMVNTIYHHLIRIGVSEEDKNKLAEPFFDRWINYFKDKENIKVFVSPTWQYFCQFKNGNVDHLDNYIKLYIPIDYNHLYKSAIEIFDYLEKNNISHLSKIGKEIRFDNIVVRLTNINDAKKLIAFVNSNPYIMEGMIKPNPFTFTENSISITSDGNLSYNQVIATYIGLYLAYMKDNNLLQDINPNTFFNFINNFYQKILKDDSNIKETTKKFKLYNNKELIDLKNITELIITSYNDYYIEQFNEYFNKINNKQQVNDRNLDENKTKELLFNAIKIMSNKENREVAIGRIKILLMTDNYNYITRENNLRYQLKEYDFANKLKILLSSKHISLENYLYVIESLKNKDNNVTESTIKEDNNLIEELLVECISVMKMKYGIEDTRENLYHFYNSNNPMLITRQNDLRNRVMSINFKEEIDKELIKNNMTFLEYLNYLEDKYELNNEKRR